MILKDKTMNDFNYDPETLAPTSTNPVWWKCDNKECGFERVYTKSYLTQKKETAEKEHDGVELCQKCSHAHRKGKPTQNVKKNSALPLPPETDVGATMERFGYDPTTLSPWSRERVIVRCQVTNRICSPRRCSLNRYKSILETGHFISTGAWTAQRRKGTKASDETRALQVKSQRARREAQKNKPKGMEDRVNSTNNPYHTPYMPKN